jgi:hypothetical protein
MLIKNLETKWSLESINHKKITWRLQTRFDWVCTWGINVKTFVLKTHFFVINWFMTVPTILNLHVFKQFIYKNDSGINSDLHVLNDTSIS